MSKSQDSGKTETEMHSTVGPMGRRNFIRAAGVGAGVVAVGGSRYSPIRNAQAIPPLVLAGAAGGVVAGAAIGYATRRVQEYLTGDDFDDAEFDALAAEETHALVREIALNIGASDDSTFTNLQNVLDLSKNAAYNDGQAAAVESMDLGGSQQEAIDAATAAIDEFYTTQQENLIDHFAIQAGKVERVHNRIDETADLTEITHRGNDSSNTIDESTLITRDFTYPLVDGSEYQSTSIRYLESDYHSGSWYFGMTAMYGFYTSQDTPDEMETTDFGQSIRVLPVESGSSQIMMDGITYSDIWTEIESLHSTGVSDIQAWVEGVYPSYEQGDIPLENLITSDQFAASAADEPGYAHSAADLGMLGVPLAEGTMVIELPESDATVEGTLSARNAPEEGFTVGETYDPANISGPVWMAYNYENEAGEMTSDVVELNESFRIVSAQSLEGESLDTVTMRSRNQRTLETDIDALNAELSQLAELQMELQEMQRQEAAGGADGSGDDGADLSLDREIWGVPLIGWGVGALAALAAIMRDK